MHILNLIANNGGSIAIDILSDNEIKAAKEAERSGLIKWESGSWGDSDYYLLTEKGRELIAQRSPTRSK